jgi:hypothetical protein
MRGSRDGLSVRGIGVAANPIPHGDINGVVQVKRRQRAVI